ncbi:MAG: hypothetical protein ACREQ5_14355 [Candidatus Dormibacteria bacterium]
MNITNIISTKITSFTKDLTTERDGITYDPARILWILGIMFYFVFSAYTVLKGTGHAFDYISFGTGFATIMASGAAAVRIKLDSEQPMMNDHTDHHERDQQ